MCKPNSWMDVLASLDRENMDWKKIKDEHTLRNLYLLSLKTSLWKRSRPIFCTVYRNTNHMTTHPEYSKETHKQQRTH